MIRQIARSSSLTDRLSVIGDVSVAGGGRVEFTLPARRAAILTARSR
jgi:hypothetical protein